MAAILALLHMQSVQPTWAERLLEERTQRGLSRNQLAARAGMTASTIWRIERGGIEPQLTSKQNIIRALGYPDEHTFLAGPGTGKTNGLITVGGAHIRAHGNVVGRVDELRPPGVKLLAIYAWGACGDPRDQYNAPDPLDLDYPPIGKERLVGDRGFGIRVKGESMANRDIHDGDVVWVNPDMHCRIGRIVLARVWGAAGYEDGGMVIKVWRNGDGLGDTLWGDGEGEEGTNPVVCIQYEVIAPVVWISPQGFPPR